MSTHPQVFVAGIGTRGFANPGIQSSPTLPNYLPGDILVLMLTGVGTASWSTPVGWTDPSISATSDVADAADGSTSTHIYYRRIATYEEVGAVGAAYIVDAPGAGAHLSQIMSVRGCVRTGSPFHDSATVFDNTADDVLSVLPALASTLLQTTVAYVVSLGDNNFYDADWASASLDTKAIAELSDENLNGTTDHTLGVAWGASTAASIAAGTVGHSYAVAKESGIALAFEPDPLLLTTPHLVDQGAVAVGGASMTIQPLDNYGEGQDTLVLQTMGRLITTPGAGPDLSSDGWTLQGYTETGAFGVLQTCLAVHTKPAPATQAAVAVSYYDDSQIGVMYAVGGDGSAAPAVNIFGIGNDPSADSNMGGDGWPSVDTTADAALVLGFVSWSDNTTTVSPLTAPALTAPDDATLWEEVTSNGSDHGGSAVVGGQASAGTITAPQGQLGSSEMVAMSLIAFALGGGGGGTPSAVVQGNVATVGQELITGG